MDTAPATIFFATISSTQNVDQVMALAAQEAVALRHGFLGTEHLLLGLAQCQDGTACQVLSGLDITYPKLWTAVEAQVGRGFRPPAQTPPATPRVWQVAGNAWAEAQQRGHTALRTGHLLLGMLRESDSVAVRVLTPLLAERGLKLQDLQAEAEAVLEPVSA